MNARDYIAKLIASSGDLSGTGLAADIVGERFRALMSALDSLDCVDRKYSGLSGADLEDVAEAVRDVLRAYREMIK